MTKELNGTIQVPNMLHWNNSANVLCNYMREQEYLDLILKNQAIIPRYVIEPLDYLDFSDLNLHEIAFPMTCFCDIPFSKVLTHMERYGQYGIGFAKHSLLSKHRIQPVHYINPYSPLGNDFKTAFRESYGCPMQKGSPVLQDYLVSTLVYMKPIWRNDSSENNSLVYQDECEWRFIPSDGFPSELPFILPPEFTSKESINIFSKDLQNEQYNDCWLHFDWDDVQYIIVPDESAVKKTVSTIMALELEQSLKYILISRIEISNHFSNDM